MPLENPPGDTLRLRSGQAPDTEKRQEFGQRIFSTDFFRIQSQSTINNQYFSVGLPCLLVRTKLQNRRDALWQVERAGARLPGRWLGKNCPNRSPSPLQPRTTKKSLFADFHGTGPDRGPHPMLYGRVWAQCHGHSPGQRTSDIPKRPSGFVSEAA